MKEVKPLIVAVDKVMPMASEVYESRMILDHVITGRENVIQVNHGTVMPGAALEGAAHEDDEIYYILGGEGKLRLDNTVYDIRAGEIVFIPAGCIHALDNSGSDRPLTILTLWRNWKANDAYQNRLKLWGTSFRTID